MERGESRKKAGVDGAEGGRGGAGWLITVTRRGGGEDLPTSYCSSSYSYPGTYLVVNAHIPVDDVRRYFFLLHDNCIVVIEGFPP